MNYQKLIIAGNVTADPEAKTSKTGDVSYATFRVAVSAGKEGTIFFPVTAFDKLGVQVAAFVKKGQQVLVEGRVSAKEDGRFNVVASRVEFGSKSGKQKTEDEPPIDEPATEDDAL